MDARVTYVRASAIAVIMRCDGYAALNASVGAAVSEKDADANNDVREDGTACHWLAELLWSTQDDKAVQEGHVAPNGRTITAEMFDAVHMYEQVLQRRKVHGTGIEIHVEKLQPVSQMFPGMQDGTPDRWYYCELTNTLYVDDLKYGFRPVSEYWNLQLFVYALTIALIVLKIRDPNLTIVLTIVQPRAYHPQGPVREFSFKLHEAAALVEKIRAAVTRAMSPNPTCTTNPGCINCAAVLHCNAAIEQGMAFLEFSGNARPEKMSQFELAYYLQQMEFARDRLDGMITAVETEMEWQIKNGRGSFPGYGMRSKLGNRVWAVPDETVAKLATLFHKDLVKAKPISPRQAEIAGIPEAVVAMYTERRPSPTKLTRLDPNEAVKAFGQHKINWTPNENG